MRMPEPVRAALDAWDAGLPVGREEERDAVKTALADLAEIAPGRSVEVRIPPHAAVQVVAGTTHRRGTPSAVVETDPRTFLAVAAGRLPWAEAVDSGAVRASGERSDLSSWLPIYSEENR